MVNSAVLIIGSSGQLGGELLRLVPDAIGTTNVVGSKYYLDLTQPRQITEVIDNIRPKIIVNSAAMTNVDRCETDKNKAMMVNGRSLKYITNSAKAINAFLIHVSTDYIFDGKRGNYREDATPDPQNYYGLSKLVGETFVESYENSLIVRTSGVYGMSNNFPLFVINNLTEDRRVPVVEGYYSPIYAGILANCIVELIDSEMHGVINVAGERISRMKFALKLAEYFSLDSNLLFGVDRIETFTAKRPFDSSLDITVAKRNIGFDFFSLDSNLSMFHNKRKLSI